MKTHIISKVFTIILLTSLILLSSTLYAAQGTLFVGGNNANFNEEADGITFIGGATSTFNGKSEHVFMGGNSVTMNGIVTKEAFIGGNIINISSNSVIGRDAYIGGNSVYISGDINGNAFIGGNTIELDNLTVLGNVYISGNNISIGDNVKINGTLTYMAATSDISSDAVISNTIIKEHTTSIITLDSIFKVNLLNRSIKVFSSTLKFSLIILIMYFINPDAFKKIYDYSKENTPSSYLLGSITGLGILLFTPVLIALLILTLIGIPIAILLIVCYVLIIFLAKLFFIEFISGIIINKNNLSENKNSHLYIPLLVMILLVILINVPIFGSLLSFLVNCAGIGFIIYFIFNKTKN